MKNWFNTYSKSKLNSVRTNLGTYLSNDPSEYDEIIKNLSIAKEKTPDELVDYVDGVNVWDKIEFTFTVKEFCDLVGIFNPTNTEGAVIRDINQPVRYLPIKTYAANLLDNHGRDEAINNLNQQIKDLAAFPSSNIHQILFFSKVLKTILNG